MLKLLQCFFTILEHFWDRVLLGSPTWPWSPESASWFLGLQVSATRLGEKWFFFLFSIMSLVKNLTTALHLLESVPFLFPILCLQDFHPTHCLLHLGQHFCYAKKVTLARILFGTNKDFNIFIISSVNITIYIR
jgi:hypothetical protein